MTKSTKHVHGEKGAYVGGCWVPIEECHEVFSNIKNPSHKTRIRYRSLPQNDVCCSSLFNYNECEENCKGYCKKSRTDFTSAKDDGSYDIVIIGAGCIGACIARELSKTKARILLIDGADDVTQGATKGNSGIVHAGYDDKPGSVRAKYCWPGNQMFPQLDRELHFGFEKNGSLVVAMNEEEEKILQELYERGQQNGVKNLRIIGKEELKEKEPYINPEATAALYSPDAGTIIPYEFTIALAENAADNGVEVRVRRKVVSIEKQEQSGSKGFIISAEHWEPNKNEFATNSNSNKNSNIQIFSCIPILISFGIFYFFDPSLNFTSMLILFFGFILSILFFMFSNNNKNKKCSTTSVAGLSSQFEPSPGTVLSGSRKIEKIKTDFIVNCGGCASDVIANMVDDFSFKIKPRLGEYILLHKREGGKANHTLFPAPHPVLGKGVLVQSTLWGNLILGPTARDILKFNPDTNEYENDPSVINESHDSILSYILSKCKTLVPEINAFEVIHTFSGARAKSTRGDWVIEPSSTCPGMIHAAAIDSPGIAGSPAIALGVIEMLKNAGANGVNDKNPNFNPNREPLIIPKNGWKGIKCGPVGKYTDMNVNVICKCEKVLECEVVNACHRSLPVDSTQAIRKRTRAGMGHCQGNPDNYDCEKRVADIIAREKRIPSDSVGKRPWPASSMLPQRWIEDEHRNHLQSLSNAV